jgi:hypothetical protein
MTRDGKSEKPVSRSVGFVLLLIGMALGRLLPLRASTCQNPRATEWERREGNLIFLVPADVDTPDGQKITDAASALAYLQKDRLALDPACIETALARIALERYKPAISTLFHYLDFLPPRSYPLSAHAGPTGGEYPGVEALGYFDKEDILSSVQKAIRDDDANTLSRINAAKLYFFDYPGPQSVRFVVNVAHSAVDPAVRKALWEFVKLYANKYCPVSREEECKKALETQ